jgi:mycoredoxin
MEEVMELEYRLLTPGERWPDDAASLAAAIRSQGPFQPVVETAGPELWAHDAAVGLTSHARLAPYPAQSYESLIAPPGYASRMTDRDRDTALPFPRAVEIRTSAAPDSDPTTVAALSRHRDRRAVVAAGRLPGRPLPAHRLGLAPLAGRSAAGDSRRRNRPAPCRDPAGRRPGMSHSPGAPGVVLYTLPYCPDCRDLRRLLNERHVTFTEVDLARTPGAVESMLKINGGRRSAPTVRIGAQVLVDPVAAEVDAVLQTYQTHAR